jgi:ribokinase
VNDPISNPQVVVLGGAAVDWVARVESLPRRDSIVLARSCEKFPGGSAANVAVGVARLGYRVGFVGKLGDDENGRLLLQAFENEGVDTQALTVERGRATATCFIGVDDHGDRIIFALPGVSLIEDIGKLDLAYLRGSRVLYIGPSYIEVAAAAAAAAHERGAIVFYAPGNAWEPNEPTSIHPILNQVDVLLVSRTEAAELTGLTEPARAVQQLGRMGPPVVIETLGLEGVLVANGTSLAQVPAFDVPDVQDTTGAGDAFAAGLIAGFLGGLGWEAAARMGCAVAALKIQHVGARSGLPTREQVASFMARF